MRVQAAWMVVTAVLCAAAAVSANVELKTKFARLILSDSGQLLKLEELPSGADLVAAARPVFRVQTKEGEFVSSRVALTGERLTVEFGQSGVTAVFKVKTSPHSFIFTLESLTPQDLVERLTLCSLRVNELTTIGQTVNAAYDDKLAVAVMGTTRFVECRPHAPGRGAENHTGCTSTFTRETQDAKQGQASGRFAAASTRDNADGWSVRGRDFSPPLDLRGIKGISLWLKGDGKGELFKVQLFDGRGYRDDYVTVNFTGWKYIELTKPALDTLDYSRVSLLNLYYNGLPARGEVVCLADDIRARRELPGTPEARADDALLEDFEAPDADIFDQPGMDLQAFTYRRYGLRPSGFGVIVSSRPHFTKAIEEFEEAAGLPSPKLSGQWNKTSPDAKRSYLFIQGFGESNVEEVIAAATRGNFPLILIGDGNWAKSSGHYEINTKQFPRGIASLRDTVARFHAAGLKVGLHLLGAGVYANDAYLTPVPDPRLVRDKEAVLGADVDDQTTTIPTVAAPSDFPKEDGGYEGDGAVLQIGEELILYSALSLAEPFGFTGCQRGAFGTKAAPHQKGDKIRHLLKSYGYFLHDMDTNLTDEIAKRVGEVANACKVDMLYFDGSERLQGPHWYYNARLQTAFYDAVENKNMLFQGSSHSHCSWHMTARYASADGFSDWKKYLDERLPQFAWYASNLMPLDLGWYCIFDHGRTLDQVEYVLQKSLGFGCSISLQTSPEMIRTHPQMPQILDAIATYERLRLSGKVPETVRAQLRQPGRDFRLTMKSGQPEFRPIKYGEWHTIATLDGQQNRFEFEADAQAEKPSLEIELHPGQRLRPGPEYTGGEALLLEDFDNLAPYLGQGGTDLQALVIGPGKAGSCREGVTQQFESVADDPRVGPRCAKYTAVSTLGFLGGWSSIGKRFDPPLDLSWHKAIGFWLKGDNSGAFFKLQLRDTKGATDYYITVNYTGWRYHELLRPEKDPIDYRAVQYLAFYYNNMPANSTCSVEIDDVKALRELGQPIVRHPRLQLNDQSFDLPVDLPPNSWLTVRADGTATLCTPENREGQPLRLSGPLALRPGKNAVTVTVPNEAALPAELLVRTAVVY